MVEAFRLLVVVFLVMHALTHVVYFLAAWTSVRTGFGDGAWLVPGEFTITSAVGRAWGIGALGAMALFLLGALGLIAGQAAWVQPTNLAVFLSFVVVAPWFRQSPGSMGMLAVFANIALMFLMAVPLSAEMVGA